MTGYDGAERLRKLVVWSSSRLPVRAHSVQIEEKEVPLDHHVQLPKSVPGAPSEERLKRKQSISANTLRLHGGSLGIDASRAVGVDYGKNLCVQMRVADLSHARIKRRTYVHKLTTTSKDTGLHESVLFETPSSRGDPVAHLVVQRVLVELQRAGGAPPSESIAHRFHVKPRVACFVCVVLCSVVRDDEGGGQ